MGRMHAAAWKQRLGSALIAAALVALLVQASTAIASAGSVRAPFALPLAPLQGYDSDGGGGGGAPPPSTSTTTTATNEPGLQGNVELTAVQTTSASSTQTSSVSTSSATGSVQVSVPPAALPSGATVQVGAITDTQALVTAAPPPSGVTVIAGFQVSATSASGSAITEDFGAPVDIALTVPADAVPAGATENNVTLAFWNGTDWVVTDATISQNADGSFSINASVTHFTLFSLLRQPDVVFSGTQPPAGAFGLMVWRGLKGTSAQAATKLLPAQPAAIYVLDVARQRFLTYIPLAPAGVSDVFTLGADQVVIVKSAGGAVAAPAPASAPAASTTNTARRTVTVGSGETLSGIGAKTGVDWQEIARINSIASPYVIQPRQVLYLD